MLFSRAMVAISNACWTNLVHDSMFLILLVYQIIKSSSVIEIFFTLSKVPVNNLNLSDSHQSSSLKIFDSNSTTLLPDTSQTGNKCLKENNKVNIVFIYLTHKTIIIINNKSKKLWIFQVIGQT